MNRLSKLAHQGQTGSMGLSDSDLTGRIIDAAIEVHRNLGPGLLESAYRACLTREFLIKGIDFRAEVPMPVVYKDLRVECGYRLDFFVGGRVVVEVKAVEAIHPVHVAQVLTYLKLSGRAVGLLVNFNVPLLKTGIKRLVMDAEHSERNEPR